MRSLRASAEWPTRATGMWEWWGRPIRDFGPKFVEEGLLSSDEWDLLQRDWAALSKQPLAFIYTPLLLQVIAERR